ncbi:MAG: hypothetical protein IPJ20_19575 [Flammeovirgaceae bacterium]|nr:hypothetical protein [Flammeovirgaceae bacterium]
MLLVFLTYSIISCSPPTLTEEELKQFVLEPDNNLIQEETINDINVRITYRPTDLLVVQELTNGTDTARISSLRIKYSKYYYFVLSLSKNQREAIQASTMPQAQFSELLQTISFRMGTYVNMTTDARDTIALADYVYNRTFGMGSSNDLLLVFNKDEARTANWLQINLAEFGLGVGPGFAI